MKSASSLIYVKFQTGCISERRNLRGTDKDPNVQWTTSLECIKIYAKFNSFQKLCAVYFYGKYCVFLCIKNNTENSH